MKRSLILTGLFVVSGGGISVQVGSVGPVGAVRPVGAVGAVGAVRAVRGFSRCLEAPSAPHITTTPPQVPW
jgi:hypothetical protein